MSKDGGGYRVKIYKMCKMKAWVGVELTVTFDSLGVHGGPLIEIFSMRFRDEYSWEGSFDCFCFHDFSRV